MNYDSYKMTGLVHNEDGTVKVDWLKYSKRVIPPPQISEFKSIEDAKAAIDEYIQREFDEKFKQEGEQKNEMEKTISACGERIVAAHRECLKQEKASEVAGAKSIEAALTCGKNLICAKEAGKQLPGFKFLKWVEVNCQFDQRTAQRYMAMVKNTTHVSETELAQAKSLRQAMIATGAIKPKKKESDVFTSTHSFVTGIIPKIPRPSYINETECGRLYRILYPLFEFCGEWEAYLAEKEQMAKEDEEFKEGRIAA